MQLPNLHALRVRPNWVLGGLALALILWRATPEFQLDEDRFVYYAQNLLHGFYAPKDTLFLWNGPGLPLLLAPFVALSIPLLLAKCLNAFFFAGTIWFFHQCLKTFLSASLSLKVTWLVGIYLLAFQMSWLHLLMTETVSGFCAAGAVYYWIKLVLPFEKFGSPLANLSGSSHQRLRNRYLTYCACYLAALALTRVFFGYALLGSALIAAGIMAIHAACCLGSAQTTLKKRLQAGVSWHALKVCALALLFCSPYLIYTFALTGRIFYWGNTGGSQLYTLTLPESYLLGDVIPLNYVLADSTLAPSAYSLVKSLDGKDEVTRDLAFREAALQNVKRHPQKFIANIRANINRLIFDYPFSRFTGSHSKLKTGNWSFVFSAWFFLGIATAILAVSARRKPPAWVTALLCFVGISFVGLSLMSAYARFMVPLLPPLFIAIAAIWKVSVVVTVAKDPNLVST